ncbi:hypothetical protein CMV_005269 [Castanea mollissima]|uniref:Uncharacterized protein n=1 Tax=Castanea mollissima TaxID=60419 RepID=A0A8J4RQF6_9ROSI|nr:hypothetical protein CMV_005269 [Castanea mollissima]
MCCSNIEQLWTETKSWEMLKKLTVLNLEVIKKSPQGLSPNYVKGRYDVIFPGSEMPEWFSHQWLKRVPEFMAHG